MEEEARHGGGKGEERGPDGTIPGAYDDRLKR